MSGLEINTKKLGEIYKEWRGNESCYDNGRPVFEADELLDFAQFCLKHEANVIPTGERQSNIPVVMESVCDHEWINNSFDQFGFLQEQICDKCGAKQSVP